MSPDVEGTEPNTPDAVVPVCLPAAAITVGTVVAVELGNEEYVLWRGRDGRVRSTARRCPHLDHDLAEGYVVADELVCPGHAWAFDGDGNAYKRNEFGRIDPKGRVARAAVRERESVVEVTPA